MITVSTTRARSSFDEIVNLAQREPVAITNRGMAVAYVVSAQDLQSLADVRQRREQAAEWYAAYREHAMTSCSSELTDEDVNRLVHDLR